MSFDDIPEGKEPSYECDCGGNITFDYESGKWVCDSCDFENKDD